MVIYTVTSRGLCCTDALSILHFAKLSDTSMDKISHLYQPLLRLLTIPRQATTKQNSQQQQQHGGKRQIPNCLHQTE